MKQTIIASVIVAALLLLSTEKAEAGGVRIAIGNVGPQYGYGHDHGYHNGYGLRRVHLRQPRLYPIQAPIYSAPRWHDTTHLDWHPGGWEWCDGRRIYVPGHYDVHQTGHFHH